MRGIVVASSLTVAFLLGATVSYVFQRSEATSACEPEIASDLSSIGFFAGALRKLEAGEPASATKLLELGLSLKAKRAATLSKSDEAPFDSTTTPNLREGLSRALSYAEARPLDAEARESLRYLHKLVTSPAPKP